MNFDGVQIAVTGLGRSGISVAKAAVNRGAKVTLLDEMSADTPEKLENIEMLQGFGVQVFTGWHGRIPENEFDLMVTSPGFARNHPSHRDCLGHGIPVISEVEFGYRISNAPVLAITGTNGKSTTTAMAWLMASGCIENAYLCGNISGSGYPELTFTEAADMAPEDGLLVAEISSYQLEWVHEFRPKAACITNVSHDHFDRHPDFSDYRNSKLRIFAQMGKGDYAVCAVGVKGLDDLAELLPAGVNLNWVGPGFSQSWSEESVILSGKSYPLAEFPFFGTHNAMNAAVAYTLVQSALGERASQGDMLSKLKTFRGIEHRLEYLTEIDGIRVFNNTMCTNPEALVTSVSSLPNRQHLLVGGNMKGVDYSNAIEYLMNSFHKIYLFGPKIPGSLQNLAGLPWPHFDQLEDAFRVAMQNAKDGELVVLSPGCASLAPYANFRERGIAFKEIVSRWKQAEK